MNDRENQEIYYRYSNFYGPLGHVRVNLHKYEVTKHTPAGVWISEGVWDKHFINHKSRKKFAYPDKETALESFKLRKQRQIEILTDKLSDAKVALVIAGQIVLGSNDTSKG